jgi:hypothetical protein
VQERFIIYLLMRGSSASRRPSPTNVNAIMTNAIRTDGMITKIGRNVICGKLSKTMLPQLAVGGYTPNPRKLNAASARM